MRVLLILMYTYVEYIFKNMLLYALKLKTRDNLYYFLVLRDLLDYINYIILYLL